MNIVAHASQLQAAQSHANSGRFPEMLIACQKIIDNHPSNADALLDVGALLLNFGFLNRARECFELAIRIAPNDLRPQVNLANLARDAGDHAESRHQYAKLLKQLPNHPVIRRNALVSLEYDPAISDADRLAEARAWGLWIAGQTGGTRSRPFMRPRHNRLLRIGYVSADICQHTVGLFVKDVLLSHNPALVQVFVYSAGQVKDWVTEAIRTACRFRDVTALDDTALADVIREDEIDLLVDLSGHTAGSRLTMFALRPAPVQVSWLGYFATTGLYCIDAVLLDEWHAPLDGEAQFVESIIRLPHGRFCYQPVPWTPPEVAPPPCINTHHVTFGCFNNIAKLNDNVFDLWAKILTAVPNSHLVLKWRTLADDGLRQSVWNSFAERGIAAERIELRAASFHADVLKEYADIDIALDPFPFTGGLTSCEALWMGVPVITWPQSRTVSRQTFALLSVIGLPELIAQNADDYVRIAVALAGDQQRLLQLRSEMRAKMQASPLMDAPGFTHQLEQQLINLYLTLYEKHRPMNSKTILHVGPGHRASGATVPTFFQTDEWQELRLDINPANEPDIVGSMLDMAGVASSSVDAIYSSHNIEHVYAYEVPIVLREFLRVLKPDGILVVTCPDLQTVCALVANDKLTDPAYQSPAGPIAPLDILYGHGASLAEGNHFMAHKCGFTLKSLTIALQTAGFLISAGKRRVPWMDLWVVACKGLMDEAELRALAGKVLPE